MDEIYEQDEMEYDKKDDGTLYVDCIRLVDNGNIRRFENVASTFDLVQYELTGGPAKPLIFYAIEHNDEDFVRTLLDMEVSIEKKYSIMVPGTSSTSNELVQKNLNAYEYAYELQLDHIGDQIRQRLNFPPLEQRFLRCLQLNDVRRCDVFLRRLHNHKREYALAEKGFFYSAEFGSVRLLDYFLTKWKIDINAQQQDINGYPTTALLTAITCNKNDAAKFLLFRHADPSIKGQYDNAFVTALHFQSKPDLLHLLLHKDVDLTAQHPDYKKLSLREYCVLTNRVKAKTEIDNYIVSLVNVGNYQRLKWLVDHGYIHINVQVNPKRNCRQLAKERYYENIVKLIDDVENNQMRARIKMNY